VLYNFTCAGSWLQIDITCALLSCTCTIVPLTNCTDDQPECDTLQLTGAVCCREYLQGLLGYLAQFYERTNPLGSLTKVYSKLEGEFESAFEEGQVPGWEDRGGGKLPGDQGNAMDLQAFDTVDELESLGKPGAALLSLLGHMLRWYSCCITSQEAGRRWHFAATQGTCRLQAALLNPHMYL